MIRVYDKERMLIELMRSMNNYHMIIIQKLLKVIVIG